MLTDEQRTELIQNLKTKMSQALVEGECGNKQNADEKERGEQLTKTKEIKAKLAELKEKRLEEAKKRRESDKEKIKKSIESVKAKIVAREKEKKESGMSNGRTTIKESEETKYNSGDLDIENMTNDELIDVLAGKLAEKLKTLIEDVLKSSTTTATETITTTTGDKEPGIDEDELVGEQDTSGDDYEDAYAAEGEGDYSDTFREASKSIR